MYTSGRTVKSRHPQPASPVKAATADARKVVGKLANGIHIVSVGTADPVTLASQVRTSVTSPSPLYIDAIYDALETLPNIVRIISDPNGVTIVRSV